MFRQKNGFLALFEEVPRPALTGNEEDDIMNLTNEYTKILEKHTELDTQPVLVEGDKNDPKYRPMVLNGHHRTQAYIEAGRKDIPVVYINKTLKQIYDREKTKK